MVNYKILAPLVYVIPKPKEKMKSYILSICSKLNMKTQVNSKSLITACTSQGMQLVGDVLPLDKEQVLGNISKMGTFQISGKYNYVHRLNKHTINYKPYFKHMSICGIGNRNFHSGDIKRNYTDSQDTLQGHELDKEDEARINYIRNKQLCDNWGIRLANENGYLSWCRNVYLASIVGATMHIQDVVPYNKDVAFVFFFMAGLNLLTGTGSYLYTIFYHHQNMDMSKVTVILKILTSTIHLLLWFGAVAIYLGYAEEENEDVLNDDVSNDGESV